MPISSWRIIAPGLTVTKVGFVSTRIVYGDLGQLLL